MLDSCTAKSAKIAKSEKRCSDCDSDCYDVIDHLYCYAGGPREWENGIEIMQIADGLCPWVHDNVPFPDSDK